MRNSDMLLAAVSSGDATDNTISAALDALREDASCDLLGAVLAVARTWRAGVDARDLARATAAIAEGSPFRTAVLSKIAEYARPDFPTSLTAIVVEGATPPLFHETSEIENGGWFGPMTCTVGCRWVLDAVDCERERIEHEVTSPLRRPRRK